MCDFSRKSSSFQATYNIKTEEEKTKQQNKKTINLLSLCQFDAGMPAEGKGGTRLTCKNGHRSIHVPTSISVLVTSLVNNEYSLERSMTIRTNAITHLPPWSTNIIPLPQPQHLVVSSMPMSCSTAPDRLPRPVPPLGSMLADWSGVGTTGSESAGVETSTGSGGSSEEEVEGGGGHSSDGSLPTDADFASAVARAAELSGMTVVLSLIHI